MCRIISVERLPCGGTLWLRLIVVHYCLAWAGKVAAIGFWPRLSAQPQIRQFLSGNSSFAGQDRYLLVLELLLQSGFGLPKVVAGFGTGVVPEDAAAVVLAVAIVVAAAGKSLLVVDAPAANVAALTVELAAVVATPIAVREKDWAQDWAPELVKWQP